MTGLENMIWENRTKDFSKVRQHLEKVNSDKSLLETTDRILNSIEIAKKPYNSDKSYYQFIKELKDDLKILSDYFYDEKWNWGDRMGHMREENKNSFFSQYPYIRTMFYNFSNRLEQRLKKNNYMEQKYNI